tara:strand:+ start:1659 stop:2066 length:408 start_codon:yes stop_codon:yes gene_type:complete
MTKEKIQELHDHQQYILGSKSSPYRGYQVNGNTLYWRVGWVFYKDKRVRGWLPILTKDNDDWIGYNYSTKDLATYFLSHSQSYRYPNLKWIEIGRGIGNRYTTTLWRQTQSTRLEWTKMINPTLDMLLPLNTFEE